MQSFSKLHIPARIPENPRVGGSIPSLATSKTLTRKPSLARYGFSFLSLNVLECRSSPLRNSPQIVPMPKRRARYGDYCQIINGSFYGVINVPIGGGKYRKRKKKVGNKTEARQWALEELDRLRHGGPQKGKLQTFL